MKVIVVLALLCGTCFGQVAIDSTNWAGYQNLSFGGGGATLSSFVVTGSNNAVMLSCVNAGFVTFNTPTLNSVSGTLVKASLVSDTSAYGLAMWSWLNVTPATLSFVVSTPSTSSGACIAWTLTNVNQSTPFGTPGKVQTVSTTNPVTITSATNHIVVSCLATAAAFSHTLTPNAAGSATATRISVQRNDNVVVGAGMSCEYLIETTTSEVMDWTDSGTENMINIAVDVAPVGGGATVRHRAAVIN